MVQSISHSKYKNTHIGNRFENTSENIYRYNGNQYKNVSNCKINTIQPRYNTEVSMFTAKYKLKRQTCVTINATTLTKITKCRTL